MSRDDWRTTPLGVQTDIYKRGCYTRWGAGAFDCYWSARWLRTSAENRILDKNYISSLNLNTSQSSSEAESRARSLAIHFSHLTIGVHWYVRSGRNQWDRPHRNRPQWQHRLGYCGTKIYLKQSAWVTKSIKYRDRQRQWFNVLIGRDVLGDCRHLNRFFYRKNYRSISLSFGGPCFTKNFYQ